MKLQETIFAEILYSLPVDKNKKQFGRMMLKLSEEIIKKEHKIILSSTVQEKIIKLRKLTEVFEDKLWLPYKN